jgi:hypothetical protein
VINTDRPTMGAAFVARSRRRAWIAVLAAVGVYAALRVAFIPDGAEYTNSFGHDSAYLTIVARNLLAGRGFVNEAHWVVFLWPSGLPMPYHNGNPLFPVLAGGLARLTGGSVLHSGFVVSALSSALLLIALTSIVARFVHSVGKAFLIACAAALFPSVVSDSLAFGTDGLATALFFAFVAALLRLPSRGMAIAAGACLGLAWLARPQVVLALPAVFIYVWIRWNRSGALRLAGALVVAAAVASPWLWHTFRVWGNPFRSDSAYYLLQDYYVVHDPQKWGTRYDRVIHGLNTPPGVLGVVKEDPIGLSTYLVRALPKVGKQLMFYWAMANPLAGLLLGGAVLFFLWRTIRPISAEAVALAVLALTLVSVLSLRSQTFDLRYFSALTVPFVLCAAAGSSMAWDAARRRGRLARLSVGACGVLLWAVIVPSATTRNVAEMYHTNDLQIGYLQLAHQVQRAYTGGSPVVVGKWPYFYSLETSAPGLSIPWDHDRVKSDRGLFEYMNKYGARFILLTDDELKYWRPEWLQTSAPAGLEQVARVPNGRLFRRTS